MCEGNGGEDKCEWMGREEMSGRFLRLETDFGVVN